MANKTPRFSRLALLSLFFLVLLLLNPDAPVGASDASMPLPAVAAGPWQTTPADAQPTHLNNFDKWFDLSQITAVGADNGWGVGGVGGWNLSHELTFSIYGSPVEGVEHYASKIVARNPDTGQWEVVGEASMDLDLTASYPGGANEDFTETSLLGQGRGVVYGESFAFVVTGNWDGHVETTNGTVESNLEVSYIGLPPYLTFPTAWEMICHFPPTAGVDQVVMDILELGEPPVLGVTEPGRTVLAVGATLLDAAGKPILGLSPTFEIGPGAPPVDVTLSPAYGAVTDKYGTVFYWLDLYITDMAVLPLEIPIIATDSLSGKSGEITVRYEDAQIDVAITDPSSKAFEIEADTLLVQGHVDDANPTEVKILVFEKSPGDFDMPYGPITPDADGDFSFEITFLSPEELYKVVVEATNKFNQIAQTTFEARYLGEWRLDWQDEYEAPFRVEPGEAYEIKIGLDYSAPIDDAILVEKRVGGVSAAGAEEDETKRIPISADEDGEVFVTFHETAPDDEDAVQDFIFSARFEDNGGEPFDDMWVTVDVSWFDLGNKAELTADLPCDPSIDDILQANLSKERITDPDYVKDHGGITAEVMFTNTNQKSRLVFEVQRVVIEGPDGDIWSVWEQFELGPGESKTWSKTVWAGYRPRSVGAYMLRVDYRAWDKEYPPDHDYPKVSGPHELRYPFYIEQVEIDFKYTCLETSHPLAADSPLANSEAACPYCTANQSVPIHLSGQDDVQGALYNAGGQSLRTASIHDLQQAGMDAPRGENRSESKVYLPLTMNGAGVQGPVRIVLDWQDPNVDLDLHILDPQGRSLGENYGHGGVRNNITEARYSGSNARPEWVELSSAQPGAYSILAYAVKTDGPVDATVTVEADAPQPSGWITILEEGFEGAFPGPWEVFDNKPGYGDYAWGKRNCQAYAGGYSGWAVGGGGDGAALTCGSDYPDNVQSWMIYGPFSLADATAAELTFKLWQYSESGSDWLFWGASTDGDDFSGRRSWGDSKGWLDKTFDLADVPGLGDLTGEPQVWIALIFASDESVNFTEGAFVDDVALRKYIPASAAEATEIRVRAVSPNPPTLTEITAREVLSD
jgi:hypothetical protein